MTPRVPHMARSIRNALILNKLCCFTLKLDSATAYEPNDAQQTNTLKYGTRATFGLYSSLSKVRFAGCKPDGHRAQQTHYLTMQRDNYSLLIEKLDAFIRKFYINHLLRGALYTVGTILGLFILLNVLEYFFYFSSTVRTGLFWGYVAVSALALYSWVALPLLRYFRLGRVISHEQAALIIGNHFTDVKDKLLNILQLRQQSSNSLYAELINASIRQKSDEIKLVPFKAAIDLGKNRKHLRWALPPLLLLLFLMQCAPGILREGSMRLWNTNQEFERPAPFKFMVNPDSLRVVQFADHTLRVEVAGSVLPNEVFIDLGKVQYRLTKESANTFTYKFTNVQQDTEFRLFGGGVESKKHVLEVIRKPSIAGFEAKLNYPDYLGRASEQLPNVGDLVVPQGTTIQWTFNAQSTDDLSLQFAGEGRVAAKRFDDELFAYNRRAMRDELYKVFISNANLPNADSVAYTIVVIPDLHPQITVEEFRDSSNNRMVFFAGDATDDYGLLNLNFNYQIKKVKGGQLPMNTVKVEKSVGKQATYQYTWDISQVPLEPGDEVSYYFEVFDNDGVNGSKSARTAVMQYKMPTLDEYRQQQAQNSEEVKKNLDEALRESLKIQEDIKKIRDKVLQKKELDWQSRKELERLMKRQQELQQQIQQAQESFKKNMEQQQQMSQTPNQELLQKQEQLEKLFEEVLSDEMKQMMEEIQKMLEEMNKDQALEQMEEMQLNNEEVNKELDRLAELYKQLEVEQKTEEQINRLEELAREQEKLAEETENNAKSQDELEKKQEELNKQMEDIKKQQEDLQKKNSELKRPQKMDDMKQEMKDTKEEMEGAQEEMQQGDEKQEGESPSEQGEQNKKASKKQKKAAGKMKNMANNMKAKKKQSGDDQIEEDLATIRQLLENLVGLSFNQEQTMNELKIVNPAAPRYVELTQQQFKIKDDFRLVEDSLQALAKRQYQLESTITEKVTEIKSSFKKSLGELEERNTGVANEHQQRAMKNINDLALILAESMQQMQEQKAGGMPGSQQCKKPGKGEGQEGRKPSDKMSKGQQGLGEQLQDMKKRMEKGEKLQSKEFAQMAARQAALRNALREMQRAKQEQGKGNKALEEIQQQMNEVETDLVNKRLTNETLKRQQDILTRLLEEERAEREQDEDEKRQAQTAQQQPAKMPPALEEYLKKRRAEVDQFRTVSPALKPYYKGLVEEYQKSISGGK
jgi:hypothetical protein